MKRKIVSREEVTHIILSVKRSLEAGTENGCGIDRGI